MKDEEAPATKADIDRIEQSISRMSQAMQKFAQHVDQRFDRTNDGIDNVLALVGNIENRLKAVDSDHEDRIRQLERHVGLSV